MSSINPTICPVCGRAIDRPKPSHVDASPANCARCHNRWTAKRPSPFPAFFVAAIILVLGLSLAVYVSIYQANTAEKMIPALRAPMPRQARPLARAPRNAPSLSETESLVRSADHFFSFDSRWLTTSGGVWIVQNDMLNRPGGVLHDCEFMQEPRVGNVLHLARPSSYVELPGSELEHPTRFTLCAWIKLTGIRDGSIIDKADWSDNGCRGYGLRIIRRKASAFIGQSTWQDLYGVRELPLDTWIHVATTYDGQILKLYVNGLLEASRTLPEPFTQSNYRLRIGNATYEEGRDRYMPGFLHDAGIFYRALGPDEINLLMNRDPQAEVRRPLNP